MAEYLAPGVYVEEIDTGSKPIEGVSTSTAGMIGVTERGPVDIPILITSVGEFRRWFGELLDVAEFSNNNGPHCYLPHAVEGFFTNGGQRLYVTRILRDDADRARFELRDRGTAGGFASALLRSAAQDTGTSVDMPLISVLDGTGLAAGDTLRIGDGSQAEYREVVTTAATRHVPLAFPALYAHDAAATIRKFDRGQDTTTFTAAFSLFSDAASGTTQITVTESLGSGDAASLDNEVNTVGADVLLEIGTGAHAEHRFVTAVTLAPSGTEAVVTLDGELVQDFIATDPVTPLIVDDGTTVDTTLIAAAPAGSTVLFGDDLQSSFDSDAFLLHIERGTTRAEVVRIGELHELELGGGAYDDYAAGSTVEHVQAIDDDRVVDGTAGTSTLTVSSGGIDGLDPGQSVTLDDGGANEETCVVQSVTAPATINLTANLANTHVSSSLTVAAKQLTAGVDAGAVTLALDSRLGLSDDDVLHLGTSPNDEYVTVSELMGDANPGLDPGTVVLTAPVGLDHAAGTEVRRQVVSRTGASGTAQHPAFLVLDAAEGDDEVYVSDDDAFTNTDLVRVTTTSGLTFYHALEDNADALTPAEVEVDTALDQNHEAGAPMVERETLIEVEALDAGSWGNRLQVAVEDETRGLVYRALLTAAYALTNEIELSSRTGVEPGTVLELYGPDEDDPAIGPFLKVVRINRTTGRITLDASLTPAQEAARLAAVAAGQQLRVRSREFRLTVELLRRPDPVTPSRGEQPLATEVFDHLSMDPRHSRYFRSVIGNADVEADESNLRLVDRRTEGNSEFIRTRDLETVQANQEAIRLGPEALVDEEPNGREVAARIRLSLGTDSLLLLDDDVYVGDDADDPLDRTGLQTLRNQEDISIVACPGRTGSVIQGALITHCEEMRYRFAVLDGPASPNDAIADVRTQRQLFDTKYAALYHPWLQVRHPYPPVPSPTILPYQVPPSGHVVGVYARTDIERGVHKAPANEVVRGILGLQQSLNKREHDILNPFPTNINVIRDFRRENRGIRVYGGRVITSDPDWKYVNVRRLLIFLEKSIERGLQWVVFEPNAEPLWARVIRSISNFLTIVWRNGALEGTSVEEAYFVKCDRTTMTQTDIDNGRLICLIGVAPVKPAEFVIIRIGLWTAHAEE